MSTSTSTSSSTNSNNPMEVQLLCQHTTQEFHTNHQPTVQHVQHIQANDDIELNNSNTDNDSNDNTTGSNNRHPPYWMIISRYLILYIVAIGLTISCPGNTLLWRYIMYYTNENNSTITRTGGIFSLLQCCIVWILFISTSILAIVSYFTIQGSVPGYIPIQVSQCCTNNDTEDQQQENYTSSNNPNMIRMNNQIISKNYDTSATTSTTTTTTTMMYQRMDDSIINNQNNNNNRNDSKSSNVSNTEDDKTGTYRIQYENKNDSNNSENISGGGVTTTVEIPLRSYCCKYCYNKCIATFDHHCHFLDTCIGECNYYNFYMFLLYQILVCIICLICIVNTNTTSIGPKQVLYQYMNSNHYAKSSSSITVSSNDMTNYFINQRILVAYIYLITCIVLVSILFGLHTYLICTNTTTYEYMKGYTIPTQQQLLSNSNGVVIANKKYPYSQGSIYKNIYYFFTIRKQQSMLSCTPCTSTSTSSNNNLSTWKPIDWKNEIIYVVQDQQ